MSNTRVEFTTPKSYEIKLQRGLYRIECYGASGGHKELSEGSKGAYVSWYLLLRAARKFFLYVGECGKPNSVLRSFNGGGAAYFSSKHKKTTSSACSGGGATDIRLISDSEGEFESLKSRIMVAAGGGGESNYNSQGTLNNPKKGGDGGIIQGSGGDYSLCTNCDAIVGHTKAVGGSQTDGGTAGGGSSYGWGNDGEFGKGGSANESPNYWPSGGGGGGYFGGGAGGVSTNCLGNGAGGSSFVSGLNGCKALTKNASPSNMLFEGNIHYSGLQFYDIETLTGQNNPHQGDGKIIITYISLCTCNTLIRIEKTIFMLFLLSDS